MRPEGVKVGEHGHRAFDKGKVVAIRTAFPRPANFRGNPRQPDVVKKSGGIFYERVVLVLLHEGIVLGWLHVVEAGGVRDANAGNAVVSQADGLGQSGPDIDHVGNDGVPVEGAGALQGGVKGLAVIMGHLLAGEAGEFGGKLSDERADRDAVRLFVAHGGDIASEAFLIKLFGIHARFNRCGIDARSRPWPGYFPAGCPAARYGRRSK